MSRCASQKHCVNHGIQNPFHVTYHKVIRRDDRLRNHLITDSSPRLGCIGEMYYVTGI